MRKIISGILMVFFVLAPLTLAFGEAFNPASVKKEAAFFYGFGSGKTAQEAQQQARNDLIADALTATRSIKTGSDSKVVITTEVSKVFKLPDLYPFVNQTDNGIVSIVYRLYRDDWTKAEGPRQAALRAELIPLYQTLKAANDKALQEKMVEAGQLLVRLYKEGVYDVLPEAEGGATLMSKALENAYSKLLAGFKVSVSPNNGLIHSASTFVASVSTTEGTPVTSLPLGFTWRNAKKGAPMAFVSTDDQGKAAIPYPTEDMFKNKSVWLKIGTTFSQKVPESPFLVNLDKLYSGEFQYRQTEETNKIAANEVTVPVPAVAFQAGSLPHDRRAATTKEKPRKTKLKPFAIDRYPVTNALYGAYLDDAKVPEADYPEYWDNEDFNKPDQPVIGISWADATKFAQWLSAKLGYTKRLATEDEYECAARGGQPFIYPWGDDQPATDNVRANYTGNGRFDGTSPVGSFEEGKNPLGLYDMSGNVWEWTSSSPDKNMSDEPSTKIVKGGSWMDGPIELRVSNRAARDPANKDQDVGFRLVREVTK